ncbi:MAG: putative toxin-antitoxin system toxin component, PIN family [Candidatus Aenigmatarchaeota archaeon]
MNTEKKKPRVVLDTNVLISGIFWEGKPAEIIRKAEDEKIEVVISDQILEELEGVLKRPYFGNNFDCIGKKIREISIKFIEIFEGPIEPDESLDVIEKDQSDNRILECAVEGDAEFIISGDKHLLELEEFREMKILEPSDFLDRYF